MVGCPSVGWMVQGLKTMILQSFPYKLKLFFYYSPVVFAWTVWCLPNVLFAQNLSLSNLREKELVLASKRFELDTLTIFPSSLELFDLEQNHLIDTAFFSIQNNILFWNGPEDRFPLKIRARYRVMPVNLEAVSYRISKDSLKQNSTTDQQLVYGLEYNPFEGTSSFLDVRGLNYSGSFARGISFGNNQDLVLNSSFNLQMNGTLPSGVEVRAAITDESIPLQPEGNTQQLREFDKIFVQLQKDQHQVTAGDYEIRRPDSYFMNYYKKLQGLTYSQSAEVFGKGKFFNSASIAVSRGKFARNQILQQEGNQGPYKLSGNEGERFIIVLAGTEKVWIDGILLNRGIEEDYVIDYNRGEVTFTNKRLITKDSRIVIEFEYSEQNFNRTLYAISSGYQSEKLKLNFNLFNEQDGKNTSGNQALTDQQKQILSEAGDNFLSSLFPSIDTLEDLNGTRVAYALLDSMTLCGIVDSILVYAPNERQGRYTARFTFVGQGNGNYILDDENVANERIYKWVGPDPATCNPRGDYEPVIQLIAPKQQRMASLGVTFLPDKNTALSTEVAFSKKDLNRFSALNAGDDQGMAVFSSIDKTFRLSSGEKQWSLNTNFQFEHKDAAFEPINPYRSQEFLRDWNLVNILGFGTIVKADENLGNATIKLEKPDLVSLQYQFSGFFRENLYEGVKHNGIFWFAQKGWDIRISNDWLTTTETTQTSKFERPKLEISKTFETLGNWKIGAFGEREKSARYNMEGDSLLASSFYFERYKLYLHSPEQKSTQFQVNWTRRQDFQPTAVEFLKSTSASEFNVNGTWNLKSSLKLAGNFTYRNLLIPPNFSELDLSNQGETYLGRTDLNLNLLKGAFRFNSTYELGSGQEPKLEFSFLRVPQGQGTHIWLDSLYNNDGVIQPVEMEIAPFQDKADYIKVTTVTNDFIRTNNVNLNQGLNLNPKAVWFNASGFKKFLSKISTQSTLKINRKVQDASDVNPWNPFQLNIADTALVAVSSSVRQLLFFNRGDAVFDIQLGQGDNRNKFVQTSGFESRLLQERFIRSRVNFSRTWSIQAGLKSETRISDSEFFNNKDYRIANTVFDPQFTYQPSANLRFSFKYTFQNQKNQLPETGETSRQHDLKIETAFNKSVKMALRGSFSWVQIDFSGVENSPVGFAMLNGLKNGKNLLWNLGVDRQLAQNIRLNISYDGRKTGTNRLVHVGRVQVAAVF